jgi:hypothetical protein
MFKKWSAVRSAHRLIEEQLYEQVVVELADGVKRQGLWAKAIADSDGHEEKAKSLYIKYRVQSIKDELALIKERQRDEAGKSNESQNKDTQSFLDSSNSETPFTKVVRNISALLVTTLLIYWLFFFIENTINAVALSFLLGLAVYMLMRFSFSGSVTECTNTQQTNKSELPTRFSK